MANNDTIGESKLIFIIQQINNIGSCYSKFSRSMRINSITNNLKELSVAIKNYMSEDSETLYKYLQVYARMKNLDINDIHTVINSYLSDYCEFFTNNDGSKDIIIRYNSSIEHNVPFIFIRGINSIIHNVNSQIETIRSTYGIEDSKDERFNKTNASDVFKATIDDWEVNDKLKDIDLNNKFKMENGRAICKQLNSFKNDILSNFNKYFGDRSVYADLKLSELIVK